MKSEQEIINEINKRLKLYPLKKNSALEMILTSEINALKWVIDK